MEADLSNKIYTREELIALPVGTEVFIEYNKDKTDIFQDQIMERIDARTHRVLETDKLFGIDDDGSEKPAIGSSETGFWPLTDIFYFGKLYRVWRRKPTDEERAANPWRPEVLEKAFHI